MGIPMPMPLVRNRRIPGRSRHVASVASSTPRNALRLALVSLERGVVQMGYAGLENANRISGELT